MSKPRKHHYVPQVHINKFKSESGFYIFNSKQNKIINQKSSNSFFFTKDLNSVIDSDGKIDHKTFEQELGNKWDGPFGFFYRVLLDSVNKYIESNGERLEVNQETLKFFYEYGVIGRLRRLKMEPSFNDSFFDFALGFDYLIEAFENEDFINKIKEKEGLGKAKDHVLGVFEELKELIQKQEQLRFKSIIVSGISDLMPSSLSFDLLISKYPLILPDCTAVITKVEEKIELNGRQVEQIGSVGIPLNPHLYLHIRNNDVVSNNTNSIDLLNKDDAIKLNQRIFLSSFNEVCSSNEQALFDMSS